MFLYCLFFFSSRRRHTRSTRDWSSDVCSSDLHPLLTKLVNSGCPVRTESLLSATRSRKSFAPFSSPILRSEERRVGKECRSRCLPSHDTTKIKTNCTNDVIVIPHTTESRSNAR